MPEGTFKCDKCGREVTIWEVGYLDTVTPGECDVFSKMICLCNKCAKDILRKIEGFDNS